MTAHLITQARAEAAARARRQGYNDRPGALPGDLNVGGAPKIGLHELRARIMACLATGPATRSNVCEECGNHRRTRDILDDMVGQGDLETWQVGKTIWYAVPK